MNGMKLSERSKEELIVVIQRLVEALHRKDKLLNEAREDLPPNKEANDRHQRAKHTWGRKKERMMSLLNECQQHVPAELSERIEDEFNHEEMLWHRRWKRKSNARTRRRARRKAVMSQLYEAAHETTGLQEKPKREAHLVDTKQEDESSNLHIL
jgi:hypothetical protein